jgi:FkbH-like protein
MHTSLIPPSAVGGTIGTPVPSIDNDVKMVIWDLDETFWNGTLAEGAVELVAGHSELVKTLAARGIISSIASKNDYQTAKVTLEKAGVWDYFVFPSISYDPKGKRVSEIVQYASLRPENVLFIDDNVLNLEEARFFTPGIMLGQPSDLIPGLLAHPRLAGNPDPELTRLKQYQLLQRRFVDQQTTNLSNEDFLRASGVKIFFDFDVDANFDRIVDLVNRANQLNYTKVRLATDRDIAGFRAMLNEYGTSAACISCRDRYGDYGVVGFYMLRRTDNQFSLVHFVFSCRTMNMGIEQYVYEFLGKPEIAVVPDVAYGLDNHKTIDWIALSEAANGPALLVNDEKKLLLVGGCELQQLASYCSSSRSEFVNKIITQDAEDYKIRYDDPHFFLTDRDKLYLDEDMKRLAAWTHDDALQLDRNLAEAKIIIVAMRASLRHPFVRTKAGTYARMESHNIRMYMRKRATWFAEKFAVVDIDVRNRLVLIHEAFNVIDRQSSPDAQIFVIGASTRTASGLGERVTSDIYNRSCRGFCTNHERFHFVDVMDIVPPAQVVDDQHLTPGGYRLLSIHILDVLRRGSLH